MVEHRFCKPVVVGSNPTIGFEELPETPALTESKRIDSVRWPENLTPILLSETEIAPDLAKLIKAWPTLSEDTRAAILRIAGQ